MKTRKGFFILILTIAVLCLTVYFSLRTTSETLSYAESEYFNGGDGSENSPYEINSSTHLSNLAYLTNNGIKNSNGDFYSKLHYKVTADIVLPNDFTPIGNNSSYLEIYAECTHGDLNFITSQWNYYYHNFYVYNGESFVNASDTYSSETTYYVKPTSFPCVFYGIFDGGGYKITNVSDCLFLDARNSIIKNTIIEGTSTETYIVKDLYSSEVIDCGVVGGSAYVINTAKNNVTYETILYSSAPAGESLGDIVDTAITKRNIGITLNSAKDTFISNCVNYQAQGLVKTNDTGFEYSTSNCFSLDDFLASTFVFSETVTTVYDGSERTLTVDYGELPTSVAVELLWKKDGVYTGETSATATIKNVSDSGIYTFELKTVYSNVEVVSTIDYEWEVSVTPAKITYDKNNISTIYDSAEKYASIYNVTPVDDTPFTVKYSTDGIEYSIDYIKSINVCDMDVFYKIEAENHYTEEGTLSLIISPKYIELAITLDTEPKTYDGNAVNVEYSYSIVSGETYGPDDLGISFSSSLNGDVSPIIKNVGEYILSFSSNNDNYSVSVDDCSYFISPATLTYSASGFDVVYDGNVHEIIVSAVTVDGSACSISYSIDGNNYSLENVGATDVYDGYYYFMISAENHYSVKDGVAVKISPAKVTLSKSENYPIITKVYDNNNVFTDKITSDYYTCTYNSSYQGKSVNVLYATTTNPYVANGKTLTVKFIPKNGNFTLANDTLTYEANVTKATIRIVANDNLPTLEKVYDNTNTLSTDKISQDFFTISSDGAIPSIKVHSATFSDKNVSDDLTIIVAFSISSTYFLFEEGYSTISLNGKITQREITLINVESTDRPYNGSTNVTLSGGEFTNVAEGDEIIFSYISPTIDNANYSENPYVVDYSIQIENDDYGNYYVSPLPTVYVCVTKAQPIVNVELSPSFIYTSASVLPEISLANESTVGEIVWKEYNLSSLTVGNTAFEYTFTPESDNYSIYEGTVDVEVRAVAPTGIEVDFSGKTDYHPFETFLPDNLNVSLVYNDGSKVLISQKTSLQNGYYFQYIDDRNSFRYGDEFITIVLQSTSNGYYFEKNIAISVNKIIVDMPSVYGNYTYSGKEITLILTPYESDLYSISGNVQSNAGVYDATLTLLDETNYAFSTNSSTATISWEIAPLKKYLPVLNKTEYVYSGSEIVANLLNPDNKTDDFFSINGTNRATNQGYYSFSVALNDKNNLVWYETNDNSDYAFNWSITPSVVEKPYIYNAPYLYDGNSHDVDVDKDDRYTLSGNLTYKNAGNYSIYATLNNIYDGDVLLHKNYVWADESIDIVTLNYVVNKIVVNKPTCSTRFTYNGRTQSLRIAQSDYYTVSGSSAEKNYGQYTATVSLNDKENYLWNDETNEDVVINWQILKLTVNYPKLLGDSTYAGYNLTALITTSDYFTLSENVAKDVGSYVAKAILKDKNNYQWADGLNNDYSINWKINPRPVDVPTPPEDLWYNGLPQTAHIARDDAYTINGNVATAVGAYVATISLIDKKNYIWKDGTTEDISYHYSVFGLSFAENSDNVELDTSYVPSSTLYIPARTGYVFDGWYDNPNFSGEKITKIDTLTNNVVLYAKWTPVEEIIDVPPDTTEKKGLSEKAIIGLAIGAGAIIIAVLIIILGKILKK